MISRGSVRRRVVVADGNVQHRRTSLEQDRGGTVPVVLSPKEVGGQRLQRLLDAHGKGPMPRWGEVDPVKEQLYAPSPASAKATSRFTAKAR